MDAERLAYAEPDSAQDMAVDASACRDRARLPEVGSALSTGDATPRTADAAAAWRVSDATARFAARLLD